MRWSKLLPWIFMVKQVRAPVYRAGRVQGVGIVTSSRHRVILAFGYARTSKTAASKYTRRDDEAPRLSGYLWKGPRLSEVRGVEEQEPDVKILGFTSNKHGKTQEAHPGKCPIFLNGILSTTLRAA